MSKNIHIPYYEVSNTIYITIRDSVGKVWHTTSKTFEVWDDSSIANHVVNSTYKEGSLYVVEFPLDISRGYYTIMIFLQSGASPVVDDDIWLGSMSSYWDKDNNNLVGVRVDTLIEYSDGERFIEKALDVLDVLEVINIDHNTEKIILKRSSDPTFPMQRESSPS